MNSFFKWRWWIVCIIVLVLAISATVFIPRLTAWIVANPWPAWTGVGDKTLWDLTELLLAPLALAIVAFLFNWTQRRGQNQIARERDETERALERDRQREDALQAYLDQMKEILLDKDLRGAKADDKVRAVIRTLTIATIQRLDGKRNEILLRFLDEIEVINTDDPIIHFEKANLSEVDLSRVSLDTDILKSPLNLLRANLRGADLRGANLRGANLQVADLQEANLHGADLNGADLSVAELSGAVLNEAKLNEADLNGARLNEAKLSGAGLREAKLSGAKLSGAVLRRAILIWADLRGANLQEANLQEAKLSGAILRRAILNGAILRRADLRGANLQEANLQEANLRGARLSGADLRGAKYNTVPYEDKNGVTHPPTQWPANFDPAAAGAIDVSKKPD